MSRFEKVVLNGENWHAGMTEIKNDGNLKYKKSYRDDCIRDDELADVVYLRSGDKEKAFGVITNRRANYYTLGEGECIDTNITAAPLHSKHSFENIFGNYPFQEYSDSLRIYGHVSPESSRNRLRIRNMKLSKEYKIKYYSPYDQINSIKEETRWGPQLTLEFPDMDTLDIILFEVFRIGGSFKSMPIDTTNSKELLTRTLLEEKKVDVKVYPNPNDGKFVVFIENPDEVRLLRVLDNLGKIIDTKTVVKKENQYKNNTLNSGVYFIEVVLEDRVVRKKVVVN